MSSERAIELPSDLRRLEGLGPRAAAVAGGVAAAGVAVSLFFALRAGWPAFFRAYILNYVFVLSFALGALFFVLIQHLTRAGWSVVVRRLAEYVAATLPWLAVAFVPVLIPVLTGMAEVYPWASPAEVAADPLLQSKAAYLNPPFFIARCAAYFLIWSFLARFYLRLSLRQDRTGDAQLTLRLQWLSGPALVLYGLSVTFFAFDVIMSLTPHWYSTIFGVYYFSGCVVGFFALLAGLMVGLQRAGRLRATITAEHYHDVGKLIFGFVVFWAYIAYSQYMLIWYANIPEETGWYIVRQGSRWWVGVSFLLLFGHFALPFVALISRTPKRRRAILGAAAAWMLAMRWLDMYYLVGPQAHHLQTVHPPAAGPLRVSDLGMLAGLGGFFALAVLWQMRRAALVPERDPRLHESLAFENV